MVALNYNPGQHEPSVGGAGKVYAEGWYPAVVQSSEFKKVKNKEQNSYLALEYFLPSQGDKFQNNFNLYNDNPDAVRIANQELAFLCAVLGLTTQISDTQQLHNIPFQVYLNVEETTDDKGTKRTQNRVKNYKYADGREFKKGAGGAPPPNAAAQNPGAPQGFGAPQGQPQGGFGAPQGQAPQGQAPQGQAPQGGFGAPQGGGFPQPGGAPQQGFVPQGQPQGGGFPQPGQPQGQPQGGFPQPGGQAPQNWGQPGGAPQGQPQQGFAPQGGGFPQPGQAPQGGGFPQPGQQPGGFGAPGQQPQGGAWGAPQG